MTPHTHPETSGFADADITFFMGLYRDRTRAEGALTRLRAHFPAARVIVRSDGDPDPKHRSLIDRFAVDYFEETRLYPIEHGGAMVARILELLLEQPTPYLLKIDTDTAVYRRFRFLPQETGVFGQLQTSKQGCVSVQGGFTGFTEAAARTILDSGVLKDERLRDPVAHRDASRYFERMGLRKKNKGLCSFDWIVGWAATELSLAMISFSEVRCKALAKHIPENRDLKFAVTHPVYFDGARDPGG